jgi:hypothetical protein
MFFPFIGKPSQILPNHQVKAKTKLHQLKETVCMHHLPGLTKVSERTIETIHGLDVKRQHQKIIGKLL